MKIIPAFLVLSLLCVGADDTAAIARIEERWHPAQRMAELKIPGVSVAVVRDSKIVWAKGYGVKRAGSPAGDPVTADTMFQAASISKPVAAVAALHMSQYGNFTLDEDVNGKLTSWKVPENGFTRVEKVTLRRLLSHSAGLTVHGFPGYSKGAPVATPVQVLNGAPPANTKPVVVDTVPGTLWRYSGGGYTVLQVMMGDRMPAKPFPAILSMIVLNPLGMANSTYEQPLPASRHKQAAVAHNGAGEPIPGDWHTYPEMAAAGLWTTPTDLAKFAIEVQKARRGESTRVLQKATAVEMLKVQKGEYGLGFAVKGDQFSHGGANAGFRCLLRATDRDAIVVMTNSDKGMEIIPEIVKAVAAEYGWAM